MTVVTPRTPDSSDTPGAPDSVDPTAQAVAAISPIFDASWYLAKYPDVAGSGIDPVEHYVNWGAAEGRQPHPLFDPKWYLTRYPDVAEAGLDPCIHFLKYGGSEDRNPNPLFDSRWYRAMYPNVATSGVNPLVDFIEGGAAAGRNPHPLFDCGYYIKKYPELGLSRLEALPHYLNFGGAEGRMPHPLFNGAWYLQQYNDVRLRGMNPLVHFLEYGGREGRQFHFEFSTFGLEEQNYEIIRQSIAADFDRAFYLAQCPDVVSVGADPLMHYIVTGWHEGRDPSGKFSTDHYLQNYPDVRTSGINPLYHYVTQGRAQGRPISLSTLAATFPSLPKRIEHGDGQRLAVVVMVKNEADIIETFAAHVLALFDVVVFVDHGSNDGTLEFLQQIKTTHLELGVYRLDVAGYFRAQAMNHIVRHAGELQTVDWLFQLDADEFLPFATREELIANLANFADAPVIRMPWKNIIPETYWDYRVKFDRPVYVPIESSPFGKVAFQPAMQGNHDLAAFEGNTVPSRQAFPLLHLPVRSINQLSLKLSQEVASYLRLGNSRRKPDGLHWFKILSALKQGGITTGHLDKAVCTYGDDSTDLTQPLWRDESFFGKYKKSDLRLAQVDMNESLRLPDNVTSVISRANAEQCDVEHMQELIGEKFLDDAALEPRNRDEIYDDAVPGARSGSRSLPGDQTPAGDRTRGNRSLAPARSRAAARRGA